ncbi:Membrane protein involved in the export of O-antigen and teichoic acid [Sulfitobacter brevis]|uniref:Membrane protein involved in the export of O-antigen and teichoic acid n=1 Tax=Sulfitobacter brevis TaxID=74348 RepID=A0A1I2AMZ3_9RHOB|nr:oligosaccharide flippase family protein [Sulfitobacter brevis]SFE44938.1 Membrane protein involved in the export of O-antigen and teichoic acid [Sulfitobacter brevis]
MLHLLGDNRLMARVARSASWIVLGYGASQAIRLASNLILTRLLFPEAFGLMALISVVTVGLTLFSDVGIAPSIAQSKRGDDPDFLNTAWTIQVGRGFGLWLAACALAYPVALFYDQTELTLYLPMAALSLVVAGFNPTRIETAHRHLLMGRLMALDLLSQVIGIATMVALALAFQSVAALVVGGVIGAVAKLALTHLFLPGPSNRFRWERAAVTELVHFGKWIFLSTVFWFFASQGDKAVLGKFLTLENFGIYNIGYFLASFPLLLGLNVTGRVMIPVYREKADPLRLLRMRYGLSAAVIGLLIVMAFAGPWLVSHLYDPRFAEAGAIVVVLSVVLMSQVIGMTYDQAALAAGDSRRFFVYSALRSTLQVGLLLVGAITFGLIGALIGMGIALVLAHLVLIWLARVHKVWDPRHDLTFGAIGALAGSTALWLHWDAIVAMARASV